MSPVLEVPFIMVVWKLKCYHYARRYFGRNFLFQHDNASAHCVRHLQKFLLEEEVEHNVMAWPVYSLDLNSIEHAWDALERHPANKSA